MHVRDESARTAAAHRLVTGPDRTSDRTRPPSSGSSPVRSADSSTASLRTRPAPPVRPSAGGPRRRLPHVPARVWVFAVVALVYAAFSLAVVHHTVIPEWDEKIYTLHIKRDVLTHREFETIYWYVALGQRGPATLLFLPYFVWVAHRMRSARPLVMLGVALLLLNVSVGAVKLATGRIGPRETVNVYDFFVGGDIYPSGHVSNAVVLYGLIAMISLHHRRVFGAAAIWISVTVGLGTICINTHWASDVVGGWFAGGLVLLALPWFLPPAERVVDAAWARVKPRVAPTWHRLRGHADTTPPAAPARHRDTAGSR